MTHLCAILLLASVSYCYAPLWSAHLRDNDWSMSHLDEIRTAVYEHHTLPLHIDYIPVLSQDMTNTLANPGFPLLSPWLFLTGISVPHWIALTVWGYAAAGALGMYWLLLRLDCAAPIALIAAVLWTENSYVASHLYGGHWCFIGVWLLPVIWGGLV